MSRRHLAEDEYNKIEKKTNTKKVAKTVAAIIVIGGVVVGSIAIAANNAQTKISKRTESLIDEYTVSDCLTLPENVTITQAYDLHFCDGEELYKGITKNGIKYCEVLDEYYTEDGRDIAVLTINGTYTEYIEADCVEVNGAKIYMAPEGYELYGEYAYRIINKSYKQIIEKQSDYSNIQIKDLDNVTIDVEEVHSRPFTDILSETLIIDVPDGAVLNENQECSASFRLVPKE